MKAILMTYTTMVFLLLAIVAPAYAKQEKRSEKQDHPQQQQSKPEHAKPEQQHPQQPQVQQQRQSRDKQQEQAQQEQQQRQAKQQQQNQNRQQEQAQQHKQQAQQQERSPNKQQQQQAQQQRDHRPQRDQQQRVQQSAWQQHRSQHWGSDHRNWQQRGGYHGYRIPDDHFRGYFGPNHGFRIHGRPFLVVGGYPRFQYQGYWIVLVDPWPEYWANDWYDNDDVYVVYADDGYYLYNRRYPNVGITIDITM